ncbi:hypothetical protein ANANG_G00281610 [Anguilla anguilla]|uniref:Uncharacterized protein n=1 Tax=Anguilla anguilla TaxID=7936 RepID=A0A9D3LNM9_ANGAN|nr:hypothetical protein ANANG_G00281610 [Anguilla anguilla]
MDVRISLSVSLLRDQLGAVIEHAVTNAVETVLEEMFKVVGCKFEEFGKEMTAKERENESIRKMLEVSRCQMKTMRKYLSAVSAKDERQVPVNHKFGKQSEPNRTVCPHGGKKSIKEHLTHVKEEHRDPPEGSGGCHGREETCETEFSQGGSADILDFDIPSLHELDGIAAATTGVFPQVKEEEPEMQLTCIKEEPLELEMHTLSPHTPDHLSDPSRERGSGWDRAGPAAGVALTAMSSSTCWAGRQHRTGLHQQRAELHQQRAELHQQRAELQQQRAELKRRGQLMAALEQERRAKTRIRVARWRAKRKMQAAGLPPPQPGRQAEGGVPRRRQQYSSLLYGGPRRRSNRVLYPPLRVGQELADALAEPEVVAVQQGILGTDSELFL